MGKLVKIQLPLWGLSGMDKFAEISNHIILVGGVVAAATGIIAGIVKLIKTVKRPFEVIEKIHSDITEIKERQSQFELAILRLNVVSEELPASERLEAGKRYENLGGNGDVKQIYHNLLNEVNHNEEGKD